MKLKTLKDLSFEEWKDRKEFVELWVKVDELKEEAIKYYKALAKLKKRDVYILGKMHAYEYFFNITEEDLK